jgi:predicted SAM-dependent methyltransferase
MPIPPPVMVGTASVSFLKRFRLARTMGRALKNDVALVRGELRRLWLQADRQPRFERYLATHPVRKLHLGAGGNLLDDWLNTDIDPQSPDVVYLDITEPLPFEDGSFHLVFSEHLIEHVPHDQALEHLREVRRIIAPGGRVRIATPDLQFLIDFYNRPQPTPTERRYLRRMIEESFKVSGFEHAAFVVNGFMRNWGHQFVYEEQTLVEQLRRAGFVDMRRWRVNESDQPALQGVEQHGDAISEEFNLMQTLVVEGNVASSAGTGVER